MAILPLFIVLRQTNLLSNPLRVALLAFTTLSMVPALIFYAFAERQIVSGLTAAAVNE